MTAAGPRPAPSRERPERRGDESPSISVVLVSWNAADTIAACLASIVGDGFDVIVVDNASADGTADLVARHFPSVRLVRHADNRGFAGGVNAGLRLAGGELVLLLNCDTVASPGAVARLADAVRRDPTAAAAGGWLVGPDGHPQHGFHARRFPTLATWLVDLWLIDQVWTANPVTRRYLALDRTIGAVAPVDVDQPAAACLMVRRAVLEQVGGLDERFHPAWFEDVDLCRRIADAGWRLLFVPDARFTHRGGGAMRALGLDAFSRTWYRNLQQYVGKHQGRLALAACQGLIVSGMLLRMGISIARGRPGDARAYARVAAETLGLTRTRV